MSFDGMVPSLFPVRINVFVNKDIRDFHNTPNLKWDTIPYIHINYA